MVLLYRARELSNSCAPNNSWVCNDANSTCFSHESSVNASDVYSETPHLSIGPYLSFSQLKLGTLW